jgi:hypothetical protein
MTGKLRHWALQLHLAGLDTGNFFIFKKNCEAEIKKKLV